MEIFIGSWFVDEMRVHAFIFVQIFIHYANGIPSRQVLNYFRRSLTPALSALVLKNLPERVMG